MLDDVKTPNSPDWWLMRLGQKLTDSQARFDLLERYHTGDHPLPSGNRKMREAYRRLQRVARSNYCGLVAETMLERLKVVGFRSGSDGGHSSQDATDKEAWSWWQENHLDSVSGLVARAAVVFSRSYVIVGKDPKTGRPLVTGEDPRQVIHESSPVDRHDVRAALKLWSDEIDGVWKAIVYTPDTIYYYRSTKVLDNLARPWVSRLWEIDDEEFPNGQAPNEFGRVPVVPFINRPDLAGNGIGEFEDVLDVQDRINTVVLDRMVISAMQAYKQRWGTGIDATDEDGNPTGSFDPGADLMWLIDAPDAKFGEFSNTDLGPLIKATESDVQHLAAITRTPPHYLIGAVVNVSGDALAAAETGLVSKTRERQVEFGESWEDVYRLCGKVIDQEVSEDCEVIWVDPEFRTLTELASASVQLVAAGVPWRTRMEMLGKTPTEIDRMESQRVQDAMLAQLSAPEPQGQVQGQNIPRADGRPNSYRPDLTPPSVPGDSYGPAQTQPVNLGPS